jgi:hypothetical protein
MRSYFQASLLGNFSQAHTVWKSLRIMAWPVRNLNELTDVQKLIRKGFDMKQWVCHRVIIVCTCSCHDAVSVLPMIILCIWSWHGQRVFYPVKIVCLGHDMIQWVYYQMIIVYTWSWHDAVSVLPSDHCVHLVMWWCSEFTTEWSLCTLGHVMMQWVYYRVIIV